MSVILVGEIINNCDDVTGFNVGNISGDDDFVEGTGAIGIKASLGANEIRTTTLGVTAPYDFSLTGVEAGDHIIMWFNTKTPINASTGLGIVVGNGTDFGVWNVLGLSFYKGGFITRVIDAAHDFDSISAGTWTLTGNPAQLSNVTNVGGNFVTLTTIMGNFNNIQLDQMTVGKGLRVDGGTFDARNNFETVRADDEDTNFYGWWSSAVGAVIGKGKLFVGPGPGTDGAAISYFQDEAFTVTFADEAVASGFYEIKVSGVNTRMDWDLANVSAANPQNSRWNLTIDPSTSGFSDTNGVWTGGDIMTINASGTMTGTTVINTNQIVALSGAILDSISILGSEGTSAILTESLDDIFDCVFTATPDWPGHAIELTNIDVGAMIYNNNHTGYAASDGSTGDEVIFVNVATGTLTINVPAGANIPSIRTAGAIVTVVVAPVTTLITVTDTDNVVLENARVYLIAGAGGPLSEGTLIFNALTNVNGQVSDTRTFASDQPVEGWVRLSTASPLFRQTPIAATIDSDTGLILTLQMISDE